MNYNEYYLKCLNKHKNILANHSAMQDSMSKHNHISDRWVSPLPDVVEERKMPPHNALGVDMLDINNFDYKQVVEFVKRNKETVEKILDSLKEEV